MKIKEKIGKRIREARERQGWSIKELAKLTNTFSDARIGNWERGERAPGPSEIILLAKILHVSPSYLYCFSDNEEAKDVYLHYAKMKNVPILSLEEAVNYQNLLSDTTQEAFENYNYLLVENKTAKNLQDNAFAIKLNDDSMSPIFEAGDIIIINPHITPLPGQYVLAKIRGTTTAIFRKYREVSKIPQHNKVEFELLPINSDWPIIKSKDSSDCVILGVMVELRRYFT